MQVDNPVAIVRSLSDSELSESQRKVADRRKAAAKGVGPPSCLGDVVVVMLQKHLLMDAVDLIVFLLRDVQISHILQDTMYTVSLYAHCTIICIEPSSAAAASSNSDFYSCMYDVFRFLLFCIVFSSHNSTKISPLLAGHTPCARWVTPGKPVFWLTHNACMYPAAIAALTEAT